jgi:hypothetical protein
LLIGFAKMVETQRSVQSFSAKWSLEFSFCPLAARSSGFAIAVKKVDVVSIDATTSAIWASLLADLRRKGRTMPVKDSLIAASALQHQLEVVTRNVGDYRHAGVRVINPFEDE